MKVKIEKASETGFCFGVRRAMDILKNAAIEHGYLETLGAVVHNEQVLKHLSETGIKTIESIDKISSRAVAISTHGVSPQIEADLRTNNFEVIDTTCPFVKRAQLAARRLANSDFTVVVFGEAQHPEVKGILGWANGKGLATLDAKCFLDLEISRKKIGLISQTTQIPEYFIKFAKEMLDITFSKDSEIRLIDTICHDIRKRQYVSLDLAKRVDLMLIIGGRTSANTKRLLELCSTIVETHLISNSTEIDSNWLLGKGHIGIASGNSTPTETIDEVEHSFETRIS